MVYAMSDLHGCYDQYMRMLEQIHFSKEDTLYILGDIVDRGPGGILLLQEMMGKKNIIPIRGNHDFMAYSLLSRLSLRAEFYTETLKESYHLWFADGGGTTYRGFTALGKDERKKVLGFLGMFLIYDELEVNGRKFFLSHTVPEKEKMLDFDSCQMDDFMVGEPDYDEQYFDDCYVVTGHTPTALIDSNFVGKIYQKNHHIAIDCGAVFGENLGCICLDTLEEFYVK